MNQYTTLLEKFTHAFEDLRGGQTPDPALKDDVECLLNALEEGVIRSATKVDGVWKVVPGVKEGILLGFKLGSLSDYSTTLFSFQELDTFAPKVVNRPKVRIVPGGSSVRRGAHLAPSVIVMPPAFVNVGAYVGPGTMVDSHALVGSCAQIGANVHLSASAQIGGVLEPIGQTPVIVEDGALIGGNSGLYEGVRVGTKAVIGAGTVITASTPLYDLVHQKVIRAENGILSVPQHAVVISGARPASGEFAQEHQLSLPAAIIIKYRDEKTDSKTLFEDLLR